MHGNLDDLRINRILLLNVFTSVLNANTNFVIPSNYYIMYSTYNNICFINVHVAILNFLYTFPMF